MFKKNHRHFQLPLTSNVDELPPKLRKRLDTSWSGAFYREFFSRLDETIWAALLLFQQEIAIKYGDNGFIVEMEGIDLHILPFTIFHKGGSGVQF